MEMMEIYWILKLDDILIALELFFCISIACSMGSIWLLFVFLEVESFKLKHGLLRRVALILVTLSILSGLLLTFTPSTKQYLAIMGGHFLTTNDKVITTTEKGFELLDQFLDEKLQTKKEESK
jgi:hypothetical protein